MKELKDRWIEILRQKATYEHEATKRGEPVSRPSINDICNEIEAFFIGLTK
jgi:hypothetical protein